MATHDNLLIESVHNFVEVMDASATTQFEPFQ